MVKLRVLPVVAALCIGVTIVNSWASRSIPLWNWLLYYEIVFGTVTAYVAMEKGRSGLEGACFGLVFGGLGLWIEGTLPNVIDDHGEIKPSRKATGLERFVSQSAISVCAVYLLVCAGFSLVSLIFTILPDAWGRMVESLSFVASSIPLYGIYCGLGTFWVASASAVIHVATRRGRTIWEGISFGVLLGPMGLLAICQLPELESGNLAIGSEATSGQSGELRPAAPTKEN